MIYKHFLTVAAGLMLTATVQAKPFYAVKADTLKKDTTVTDTTKVEKEDVKSKAKKEPKETEYQKIIKKGGTVTDGLFRVRHIEDKYYFEVPDSMLGRYILCVTRFTAVPQNFGQVAG